MIIEDIFEHHEEQFQDPMKYGFAFMISGVFSALGIVQLLTTTDSHIVLFFIFFIPFCVFIFSIFKLFQIKNQNPKLWRLIEEFWILKNSQNPDFFILKKQEILLEKIIAIFWPKRFDKINKTYFFQNEITINNKTLFIKEEEMRIIIEMKTLLEKNINNPIIILQKNFTEIFEQIIQGQNEYRTDKKLEEFSENIYTEMIKKSIFEWIIATFLYIILSLSFVLFSYGENILVSNKEISINFVHYIMVFIMMIVFFFGLRRIKTFTTNVYLQEHFSLLINSSITYLSALEKTNIIHHSDALFFADLMNFLWKNISERGKTIKQYEKFFTKIYTYFFIKYKMPQEIQNFFIEAKFKLRNDAFLVQKIIEKWAEIEKYRLEKNSQNSNHPVILASNKRREIMIKNLQNISQKY